MATAIRGEGPLSDLNTTPLIDVMLVLLVMFIITIPVATHTTDVGLPAPCVADCPNIPEPDRVANRLVVDAQDRLMWNGTAINDAQLVALLRETAALPVEPELQYAPDANASYAASARTLHAIKASGVTRFGFVGNDRFRNF